MNEQTIVPDYAAADRWAAEGYETCAVVDAACEPLVTEIEKLRVESAFIDSVKREGLLGIGLTLTANARRIAQLEETLADCRTYIKVSMKGVAPVWTRPLLDLIERASTPRTFVE